MTALKYSLIVLYVAVLASIGIWSSRRSRSVSDFFLGSRNIGPWMSAFAYGTTYFSAVLFVGYAGRFGWQYGLGTMWIVAGNTLLGSLAAWMLLARRTRRITVRLNAMTMPEFLERRYGSPGMKWVAAGVIFVFLMPYTASIYQGLSYLFREVLGINYTQALVGMALLTGLYLVAGGYLAVNLNDFIQGMVMVAGGVLMVVFLGGKAGELVSASGTGGAGAVLERVNGTAVPVPAFGPPAWLGLASLVLLTSLGPLGMPQMVQKFYAIRGEEHIRRATVVATLFAFACTFCAYFSGALSRAIFTPEQVKAVQGGLDNLMPTLIQQHLPQALALVVMLLVLSASMSTLSSLVLVSSSAVSIDLAGGERRLGPRRATFLMRLLCAVFVGLSLLMALKEWSFIVNLMSLSWGAVAGAFIAPYVYGLFWRRATRAGAWASMLAGLSCAVLLPLALSAWWAHRAGVPFSLKAPWVPFAASISMLLPLSVMPAVSLLTRKPDPELLQAAFGEEDAGGGDLSGEPGRRPL
jgi:SSS family transporter